MICACERAVEHFSSLEVPPDVTEYHKRRNIRRFSAEWGLDHQHLSENIRWWGYESEFFPTPKLPSELPPSDIFHPEVTKRKNDAQNVPLEMRKVTGSNTM